MEKLLQSKISPLLLAPFRAIIQHQYEWKQRLRAMEQPSDGEDLKTAALCALQLEGAKVCLEDIDALGDYLNKDDLSNPDILLALGYMDCRKEIHKNYKEIPLSEESLYKIYQKLVSHLPEKHLPSNLRSNYKIYDNPLVRINEETGGQLTLFETSRHGEETQREMRQLIDQYTNYINNPTSYDLMGVGCFIVRFLSISPYVVGNICMGLLLLHLLLLKSGYEFLLLSNIEVRIKEKESQFFTSLRQSVLSLQGEPDMNYWLLFFVKILSDEIELVAKKLSTYRPATFTILEEKVFQLIRENQPVTIGFLERESDVKRVTLKSILARLKGRELIQMDGQLKSSRYRTKA